MQRFLLAKRAWVVLSAAVCAGYFYGLGAVPLLGPDEPRYAQVAREMFGRGDWVTPTLGGQTWFEKPALLYWLMAVAYGLFGVSEFAARFGSALSGVLTVLLAGWAARRAEFESGEGLRGLGVTCAAVAASTLGLLVFARASSFDTLLTMTVTGALVCFYCSEVERGAAGRKTWLIGFYGFVGASLLAKGLVGVVIPGAVIVVYYALRRRWPGLLRLGVPWGALLASMVAAAWYGPVIARHGHAFVDEFFMQHHFARYVSNKYHHPQPFWFYLPVTLGLALPWTAFLVGGVAGALGTNARAEDAASKLRVLALAWLAVPVLFFSASGSKLPGYVLPALPGAALLAGDGLHRYLRGAGGLAAMRLTGLLALAAFAAGVVFLVLHVGEFGGALSGLSPVYVAALLLPSGLTACVALFTPRRRELCAVSVVGATLLTVSLVVAGGVLERATRKETLGRTLAEAAAQGFGGLPVVNLHTVERTSEFYAAGRLAYDASGEPLKLEGSGQVADFARGRGGAALVIVHRNDEHQLFADPALESKRVAFNGRHALVYVKSRQ